MAKETMQAVSQAEQQAAQLVKSAQEESERAVSEASQKGAQLMANAVREAQKKTEILLGVARADGEKIRDAAQKETEETFRVLEQRASLHRDEAISAVKKIVLGER